jgi:uncharacterized protein YbjT (DUF2867 family)
MSTQKVIAVVGATGSQGGGLVRAILDHPGQDFTVRALTRDPASTKARELAAAGAEVVAADLDDPASMRAAFDGAHGAYVVTNYWAPRSAEDEKARTRGEMELAQAGVAARAAKDALVPHVIWSTLEDTRDFFGTTETVPTIDGRYKVPHFDAKSEADALFADLEVPTTFLRTTFFFEGMAGGLGPVRGDDGTLILTMPMADQPLAGIAVEDIGRTALGIFKRGNDFVGKTVSIAGDHLTGPQYAAAFADALGETVRYQPLTWDQFRGQPFPTAIEMANMFQYYAQNSTQFVGDRRLAQVRELNPQLQSFRDWLAIHRGEISVD